MKFRLALISLLLVSTAIAARAQNPAAPAQPAPAQTTPAQSDAAGRWEGQIDVPGNPIGISIDLARRRDGSWQGTFDVPSQGAKEMPLVNLEIANAAVNFGMAGVPGYPLFKGRLSPDGKTIAGDFSQAGQSLTFKLERKGAAKPAAETSEAVPEAIKSLSGLWSGTLDVGAQQLRLVIKLAPPAGLLDSVDQSVWIPVDSIAREGQTIKLEMKVIGGFFDGKLSADGATIEGTWSQSGGNFPLTLKRAPQK
jgi:hypothetical protein